MILTRPMIQALLTRKAKEIRFPDDYEHLPDQEGHGEVVPVQAAPDREPVCWVLILGSWHDDDQAEYVYEIQKVAAPDTPRLLMPMARAGDGLGYTTKTYMAMRDEPEAVDADTQNALTTDGWAGFNAREKQRLADRRLMAIEERMRLAWGDGQRLSIDLSDNLKAIDRIVSSMERKTSQLRDAA